MNNRYLQTGSLQTGKEILMYKQEYFTYGEQQIHVTCGLVYYEDFDELLNLVHRFLNNYTK